MSPDRDGIFDTLLGLASRARRHGGQRAAIHLVDPPCGLRARHSLADRPRRDGGPREPLSAGRSSRNMTPCSRIHPSSRRIVPRRPGAAAGRPRLRPHEHTARGHHGRARGSAVLGHATDGAARRSGGRAFGGRAILRLGPGGRRCLLPGRPPRRLPRRHLAVRPGGGRSRTVRGAGVRGQRRVPGPLLDRPRRRREGPHGLPQRPLLAAGLPSGGNLLARGAVVHGSPAQRRFAPALGVLPGRARQRNPQSRMSILHADDFQRIRRFFARMPS